MLLKFLETGGIVGSESCKKEDRPPSATESGWARLRRLQMSRAIGGYSLTSDDPVPGLLTVFQSWPVSRPQDASKAPHLEVIAEQLSSFYLGCVSAASASSCF